MEEWRSGGMEELTSTIPIDAMFKREFTHREMIQWVLIALVASVAFSLVVVYFVVQYFGP